MLDFGTGGVGVQSVTNQTDIAIGTSGKPVRVFHIAVQSGGTAAVVILRNGTSASAQAFSQIDGTINKTVQTDFGNWGMFFPAGCFLDVDANTTYATVLYRQEIG